MRRRRTEFGETEQGDEYKLKHVKRLQDVKKNLKMVCGPSMQHSSNSALSVANFTASHTLLFCSCRFQNAIVRTRSMIESTISIHPPILVRRCTSVVCFQKEFAQVYTNIMMGLLEDLPLGVLGLVFLHREASTGQIGVLEFVSVGSSFLMLGVCWTLSHVCTVC